MVSPTWPDINRNVYSDTHIVRTKHMCNIYWIYQETLVYIYALKHKFMRIHVASFILNMKASACLSF